MARRKRNTRRSQSAPGWLWMLLGLSIGLVIAAGVYFQTAGPPTTRSSPPKAAADSTRAAPAETARGKPAAQRPVRAGAGSAAGGSPAGAAAPERRFDFYDILPQYEVVVPDAESAANAGVARVKPIQAPGSYVLQAGSFGAAADADKVRASIALLGIESRIQHVTIDDAVFNRVRIGPISDLDELNRVRKRLHDAHIDAVVMKATE
jgi:cell division protein FtsN